MSPLLMLQEYLEKFKPRGFWSDILVESAKKKRCLAYTHNKALFPLGEAQIVPTFSIKWHRFCLLQPSKNIVFLSSSCFLNYFMPFS